MKEPDQIIHKCRPLKDDGLVILSLLADQWENGELKGKPLLKLEEDGRSREKGDGKQPESVMKRLRGIVGQGSG